MTQHLIGLGDEAPRDTSPTLAAHMTVDELFAKAKRLNVRVLGTPEEVRAALDSKDAEIQRLTAERDALRAALHEIGKHVNSSWPDRCQKNVRIARAALAAPTPKGDEMVRHFQKRWRLKFRRDPDAGRVLFIGPLVISFDVVRKPASKVLGRTTPKEG
jgi:hypothetical protein